MSGRRLPPGECLQTGIALRAALVLAGLAAGKLVELVEQLAQGVPGDDRLAASEAHSYAGPCQPLLALIEVADGGASFSLQCVRCGTPFEHRPPGADDGGDYLAHLWACPTCKAALRGLFGTPASPGRPADPPYEARVKRLRGLSHRLSRARSQQPESPTMPRPSGGRPGASSRKMPEVSPWT